MKLIKRAIPDAEISDNPNGPYYDLGLYSRLHDIFDFMKTFVAALVKQISEIIQREFAEQSKKIDHLLSRIESLEVKSKEKDKRIDILYDEIDDLQQYGRRKAVVISRFLEHDGENTDAIMLDIANNKLKVKLEPHEMGRSHRLGPTRIGSNKPRNIVVKLVSFNVRKRLYDDRKSFSGREQNIYISEHLAKRRGELFYQARKFFKIVQMFNKGQKSAYLFKLMIKE